MTEKELDVVRMELALSAGYNNIRPNKHNPRVWEAVRSGVLTSVPDWPRDSAAALALCLEIARKRNYVGPDFFPRRDNTVAVSFGIGSSLITDFCDTPAEALARLALAALEG